MAGEGEEVEKEKGRSKTYQLSDEYTFCVNFAATSAVSMRQTFKLFSLLLTFSSKRSQVTRKVFMGENAIARTFGRGMVAMS